jgi:hypothetical protein
MSTTRSFIVVNVQIVVEMVRQLSIKSRRPIFNATHMQRTISVTLKRLGNNETLPIGEKVT